MSYFALADFPQEKVRCKAKPRELNAERVRSRSELVSAEAQIIANNPEGNFIHKGMSQGEVSNTPRRHGEATERKNASNNIFGPPVDAQRPGRRMPIPDAVKEKVYPEHDVRKERAQDSMASGATLVDKMHNQELYPTLSKAKEPRPAMRKVDQPEYHAQDGIDGFYGLGANSKPNRKEGVSTRTVAPEYFVPDLPERKHPLSPRVRANEVYNPLTGEKSPHYGH